MGEVEFLNRQTLDYFGRTSDDLKNWPLIGAVHPDDLPGVLEARRKSIEAGHIYDVEHRCRRADGAYRWFQVRGLPVRNRQGSITSWYLLLSDIEERKRAEDKLRRSEDFLAEGQRLTLTGSFSWKVATDEITWSEQLYRIYEFDVGVPVTLELIRTRVHPEDVSLIEKMKMVAEAESHNDFEWRWRLKMPDHSIKYLHAVAHLTRDRNGQLEYIAAVQDVTAHHLSEEALSRARSELAKVARVTSLGVLTASIAHEVNQPLSGIITNASTCLRMLSADPPNVEGARETARRTIRDGNRASDVITRVRKLYSKTDPQLEWIDLNEAAREVTSLSLNELHRNGVILRQEFAESLPPVMADRVQLQQVILNLLRNASDAMSSVQDRPRELVIRTESDGDNVFLSVKDTGVGFSAQSADRLFEAFYTTKTDGIGIGLSISHSIIAAHHGRLWAKPNDGPGATFSLAIPCQQESSAGVENRFNAHDRTTDAA
jgi:PAS domain S-box-containing protein